MNKVISNGEFNEIYKSNKKINIIDVREDFEYAMGHIPGAQSKPLSSFSVDLDKDEKYYIICQSGGRSAMVCQMLEQAGYEVVNVNGGMSSWRGAIE